ncbi:MAG: hypothetical protein Q8O67_09690 [Deltaproteobacteria bacterium]|nr:hypothetical protein [Deltaproteobacteria bacterium]
MLALLLTSLLSAQAPTPAAPPTTTTTTTTTPTSADSSRAVQVLLMDLAPIDISPEKVKLLVGKLAAAMGNRGLEVITGADLRTMAGLEADKAAAGCDEGSASCLAEIASALGARLVVSGQVGALDDNIFLQLSLFDAQAGRAVAREESRGKTLTAVADTIPELVDRMLIPILGAKTTTTTTAPPPAPAGSMLVPVGGALLAAGGVGAVVLGGWAFTLNETLVKRDAKGTDKQFAYNNGVYVVVGAGASAVVAGVGGAVLFLGLSSE